MMKNIIFLVLLLCSATLANASTTIVANIVRNQSGSGDCLISSGFPLPIGLVTEQLVKEAKIKVLISGAEIPANITALRGRHSDGSLRSVLIQFTRSMSQGESVPAQVIIGDSARVHNDPAYIRPTLAIVQNNNVIVPSDVSYLTTTRITLRGLLPSGLGTTEEEKLYTWAADDRFDALMAQYPTTNYQAVSDYDHISAIISLWARTGNIKYQKAAIVHAIENLPYDTPTTGPNPSCNTTMTIANPDGRTGGQGCGVPSEPHYARYWSYAQLYLLTGYRDFWGIVAASAQYQQNSITSQAVAYEKIISYNIYDTPRRQAWNAYGTLLPALMIDATIPVNGQYFTGREFNWNNQLTWTVDALEHWKWDFKWIPYNNGSGTVYTGNATTETTGTVTQGVVSATLMGVYQNMHDEQTFSGNTMPVSGYLMVRNISGGTFTAGALTISGGLSATATGNQITDYREGLAAGVRAWSPRGNYSPWDGTHSIPTFQLVFPTNFLIDTYLYFNADARIPAMVKKNVEVILRQLFPKAPSQPYYNVSGGTWGDHQYVKSYKLENPVATYTADQSVDPIPFELPEYVRMIAFVLKTSGDETVNGKLLSEWYDICIDIANVAPSLLTWGWKYFGQFYSWGQDAPWIMAQSSLSGTTYRMPIQYSTIPGDVPDVSSEAVNDSCGPSSGIALSSAPSTGLCSAGTASAVSGTGPWSWTCAGSGGGSTANCSASLLEVPPTGNASALVACSVIAGFR